MANLEIYGWLHETSWGAVPKNRLQQVMDVLDNDEFDRDDFDDILDNNNETGVGLNLDIEVFVDGVKQEFDSEKFSQELSEADEIEDDIHKGEFFLIEETISKGLIYSCEIQGDFNINDLSVWFYNYLLGDTGVGLNVLEIDYNGLDCADRNTEVNGYYIKLLRSDGQIHDPQNHHRC